MNIHAVTEHERLKSDMVNPKFAAMLKDGNRT